MRRYEKDGRTPPIETAGRSYSVGFMLFLDQDLQKQSGIHAAQHNVSLNKYCTQHLEQAHKWELSIRMSKSNIAIKTIESDFLGFVL